MYYVVLCFCYIVVRYAAWRQRGTTWRKRRDYNEATAWLARGDNMAQRGTLTKFANLFPECGDQKRATTAWPKLDTMTGALGNTTTRAVHIVNAFVKKMNISTARDCFARIGNFAGSIT